MNITKSLQTFTVLAALSLFAFLPTKAFATSFYLSPSTSTLTPGQTAEVDIMMTTDGQSASAFSAAVDISNTNLAGLSITASPDTAFPNMTSNGAGTGLYPQGSSTVAYIAFIGTSPSSTYSTTQAVSIGTISFTVPSSGNAIFSFVEGTDVLVNGASTNPTLTGATYTFQASTTLSPTPTQTPTPPPSGGDVTMDFTARLQGITSNVGSMDMTVSIKPAGSVDAPLETAVVSTSSDGEGVFSGTANFTSGLADGSYKICVKGPSHLQSCLDSVQVTGGSGSADLAAVDGKLLLVGDVTQPGIGQTDGDNVITLADVTAISSLRNSCGYVTHSVPVGTVPCNPGGASDVDLDVDRNGFVTIQDLSLVLLNFTSFERPGDN